MRPALVIVLGLLLVGCHWVLPHHGATPDRASPDLVVLDRPVPGLDRPVTDAGVDAARDLPPKVDLPGPDLAPNPDLAPKPDLSPNPDAAIAVPKEEWTKIFGGQGSGTVTSVVVDGNGNVTIAGWFNGSIDLGGGVVNSNGNTDLFVASYKPDGSYRWSKPLGGSGMDKANGLAVDSQGNLTVTGFITSAVNFGGTTTGSYTSGNDIFVASFNSSGAHRWSKIMGGTSDDAGWAIAADPQSRVVVSGIANSAKLGGPLLATVGAGDAFIACYDGSGVHVGSTSAGSSGPDVAWGVAIAPNGDVIVAGTHSGPIPGSSITHVAGTDVFVGRYPIAVTSPLWAKGFGSSGTDLATSVAVDSAGNITFTGYHQQTIDFGGGGLTAQGGWDAFAASVTTAGTHRWSTSWGSAGTDDKAHAVAVDPTGNVLVGGEFSGTVSFGGPAYIASGIDLFLASYTGDGLYRWSLSHANPGSDRVQAIAAPPGVIYMAGGYSASSTTSAFLRKLVP